MINSTENITSLLFIGFICIFFVIMLTLNNSIVGTTESVIENSSLANGVNISNNTIYSSVKASHTDTFNILKDGFKFILYIIMGMTLYSSFTQKNSITSYFFSFVLSIIAGALVIYIMTYVYNTFIANTNGIILMDDFPYFFFDNFTTLVVANIVAGILSFIFVQRGGAT